ncbi:glutamate racemase [Pelosinus sp. sgz500959]|uniref:glutamate racemase n=1 Tax=Pelosinus sp. sgz500959 TaxID=3242472 RepID=UPI00366FC6DB
MSNNAPIGVFDSGIGGLTVVKELIELMPGEEYIYFGDTARMPYGPRPAEQILEFMHQILQFFAEKQVKMAVVACNTMTALGIDMARQHYPFPLVGVNAGVDLALSVSPGKNFGVIATQATIASGKHAKVALEKDKEVSVYSQACPKLVPLIENEQIEGSQIESAVAEYLLPMKQAGVESIILGCTHYPFVSSVIEKIVGRDIVLVNPARETAMDAYRILQEQNCLSTKGQGKVRLCFSADVEQAKKMAGYMLDTRQVDFELVNLQK